MDDLIKFARGMYNTCRTGYTDPSTREVYWLLCPPRIEVYEGDIKGWGENAIVLYAFKKGNLFSEKEIDEKINIYVRQYEIKIKIEEDEIEKFDGLDPDYLCYLIRDREILEMSELYSTPQRIIENYHIDPLVF
ncbi:hypothetical protein DWX10_16390 [Clostridium sp. AF18-27]|uniref:hypothetical protein n=1 Tax=Enterocloster lavalensis TaxID=460384 RepID=UPI000E47A6DE|nr:hypothetical protein [Enterocloster lavalensis]RHR51995.1 hypothetical protein DWX10_16390 [Clostridium sp. AF18-27]